MLFHRSASYQIDNLQRSTGCLPQTCMQSLSTSHLVLMEPLAVQNVLKVFASYPAALMDVVRCTDPSTVTQHGMYTRDLSVLHQSEAPKLASSTAGLKQSKHPLNSESPLPPQANTVKLSSQKNPSLTPDDSQSCQTLDHANGSQSQTAPQSNSGQPEDNTGCSGTDSTEIGQGAGGRGIWGQGRVTLLGDAAHPTVPSGEPSTSIAI